MGLDINGTQCILYAKKAGIDFARTALIGRQSLNLKPSELKINLRKFGFPAEAEMIRHIFRDVYAEDFFRFLGAETVDSFDFSDYESATCIHDMNQPINDCFKHRYSIVLDSGTLEHVFNFPIAIKNCMEMVEEGGYYLGITPANNFMGHGFYQFSPELFFSLFSSANGFNLISLIAFEDRRNPEWYRVTSPDSVKCRVTLCNSRPTYLFVMAKRIKNVEPFLTAPQQSDYVAAWDKSNDESKSQGPEKRNALLSAILRHTPKSMKRRGRLLLGLEKPLERFDLRGFNPRHYRPINLAD